MTPLARFHSTQPFTVHLNTTNMVILGPRRMPRTLAIAIRQAPSGTQNHRVHKPHQHAPSSRHAAPVCGRAVPCHYCAIQASSTPPSAFATSCTLSTVRGVVPSRRQHRSVTSNCGLGACLSTCNDATANAQARECASDDQAARHPALACHRAAVDR